MLRLENISAGYGAVSALRNVDMVVASGEVVALIGSNGAGKSTTLRTISGLVRPSTGKIEFQGEAITDLSVPARYAAVTGPTGAGLGATTF